MSKADKKLKEECKNFESSTQAFLACGSSLKINMPYPQLRNMLQKALQEETWIEFISKEQKLAINPCNVVYLKARKLINP